MKTLLPRILALLLAVAFIVLCALAEIWIKVHIAKMMGWL